MDSYDFYMIGNEYFEKGDYFSAIACYENSNKIAPHFKNYERLFACYNLVNSTNS